MVSLLLFKISFLFSAWSFVTFFLYFLLSVTFWNYDRHRANSTKSDTLEDRFGDLITRFLRLSFLRFFTLFSFNVIFNVKFRLMISFFMSTGYADFMASFNSLPFYRILIVTLLIKAVPISALHCIKHLPI